MKLIANQLNDEFEQTSKRLNPDVVTKTLCDYKERLEEYPSGAIAVIFEIHPTIESEFTNVRVWPVAMEVKQRSDGKGYIFATVLMPASGCFHRGGAVTSNQFWITTKAYRFLTADEAVNQVDISKCLACR
jgi:hypothetical protein